MHTRRRAFSLIELMIVISVMALMAAMLIPSMSAALEQSRIVSCASVLHHIGNAYAQYLGENNDHFPSNPYRDFRLLIGPYLGMSKNIVYNVWQGAQYPDLSPGTTWDKVKQFQCPSGAALGVTASANGQAGVQSYWLQNGYLGTGDNNGRLGDSYQAYVEQNIPTDNNNNWWRKGGPSHNVLLCEHWQTNGVVANNPDILDKNVGDLTFFVNASDDVQPYTTHSKFGNLGVMGVGRNMLFLDWHIRFRRCTYSPVTSGPGGYWSDATANAVWVTTINMNRGNEAGQSFQISGFDSKVQNTDGTTTSTPGGGKTFWGWRPIIDDADVGHWMGALGW
jgi:prepilin-type N-terminal cleavage/methylation domain-containing protein